ncbi:MAG: aminotransferase class IV [Actinomycetota bacterium]
MTQTNGSPASGTHAAVPDARNDHVLVWINDQLVPRPEATVSVFDSAFLVGDGVWEGLRLHDGVFAYLDRHLDRLFASAAAVGLDIGRSRSEIETILHQTVDANGMTTNAHVRLMVSRGTKKTPSQDPRLLIGGPTIVVIAEHKLADPAVTAEGITLFTSTIRRPPPDTIDQRWNCHSKLHEVVALIQAIEAGADEALMLDPHGFVATCNATNFFIVTHNAVWTSTGDYCLNGITRGVVLELAAAAGLHVAERNFTLTDVYAATEAFVTGTFGALTPVTAVDGRTIGEPGVRPITHDLQQRYAAAVHGGGR